VPEALARGGLTFDGTGHLLRPVGESGAQLVVPIV